MITLAFPDDMAVGTVAWKRRISGEGPTMAMGSMEIPDDARVTLRISSVASVFQLGDGRTSYSSSDRPVDLSFLADLPEHCIDSLHLGSTVASGSARYLPHIAPGLRSLYLAGTELKDAELNFVSQLSGLTYLQTFDNDFTDEGVQVLADLRLLESLYLEERSLSAAAFAFVHSLPRLKRLGLQDVPIEPDELAVLQAALPDVEVG